MKTRHATAGLTVLLLLTACLGEEGEWAGTVTDSAGVAIVTNPPEGMWADGEGWTLEEELRIGSIEAEPEYQFGQIGARGIAVGSDGRLYVLDAMAQEVRVFTPSGTYERTIGGPGSGPGEIGLGANFLLMGRGDTLLLPDLANQRITWYADDGEAFGSERLDITNGMPMVFAATASGAIVGQIRPLSLPNRPAADSMDAIVLLSASGTPIDTLMRFESGKTFSFGGDRPELKIFSPEPAWDVTDQLDVLYGMNDEYRVSVYGADGQLQRVVTKPFERTPVTESDQDLVLDFIMKAWRAAGLTQQQAQRAKSIVQFAKYYPAFGRVVAGPLGTIWVQEMQPPGEMTEEERQNYNFLEDAGSRYWDIFDDAGRYLGVLAFPNRFQPRIVRGDKVYGVWRDELDVQYVMRFGIRGLAT